MERDHRNVHTESQSERMRRVATISDNSLVVSDSDKEKEDGAMILMMLSRDFDFFDKKSHDDEDLEDPDEDFRKNNVNYVNNFDSGRGGYKCKTCNKVFHSYQALGGHRASHNVGRAVSNKTVKRSKRRVNDYECPVCGKVFASGQALGGHKRSHWASNSETSSFDISFRVSNDQNFWM